MNHWSFTSTSVSNMLRKDSYTLAVDAAPEALQKTWKFFSDGGFFMLLIVLCSLVALIVILYKMITLTRAVVVPDRLAGDLELVEVHVEEGRLEALQEEFRAGESSLARLCDVAMKHGDRSAAEAQESVQASAKEEVVRMHAGLSVLDVVITVAPLLGLLGTASGLVLIFGNTEDLTSGVNNAKIGSGIARALGTTIAGMVVAVPSVVAHSYFTRKIETMSARLEVLLGILISACQRRPGRKGTDDGTMSERPAVTSPQLSEFPR